jgi:glutathione S-transferase
LRTDGDCVQHRIGEVQRSVPAILYNGPTSPFGRMARVVALELGVPVEERVIDVYSAEFLDALNPLRQIPTLITETGAPIYDSRVICRYFDAMSGRASLIAPAPAWEIETRWALALGVMEAGLQRRMEITRPAGEQSPGAISKLEVRINRALLQLEREREAFCDADARMDSIATAVALEYTDFRYTSAWRHHCPKLNVWLQGFARRPSMVQTRPSDGKQVQHPN